MSYHTIGNVKPEGLCGSAIIDAVAELFKCGVIDKNGKFTHLSLTPRQKKMNGEKGFILVSREEGATRDIIITQKDIEEIQLAKESKLTTFKSYTLPEPLAII